MAPEGLQLQNVTWRGMPIPVALDSLDTKVNIADSKASSMSGAVTAMNAKVETAGYLGRQYEQQSENTQKLLKELISEIADYKEEFKRLSEHCDELEQEVKELRDKLERNPYIDLDQLKEKVKKNGSEWPEPFPHRWEPTKINWTEGDGKPWPGTKWEITCKADADSITSDSGSVDAKALFKAVAKDMHANAAAAEI